MDVVVYDPRKGKAGDLPEWAEIWANKNDKQLIADSRHWLEIAAEKADVYIEPEELELFPENILEICSKENCSEPEPIDLSYLNHGRPENEVVGLELMACCVDQANTWLHTMEDITKGCNIESFKIIVETAGCHISDNLDLGVEDVSIECLNSAPLWARPWLDEDYKALTEDQIEIANTEDIPYWLEDACSPAMPEQAQKFFIDWVESNSEIEIGTKAVEIIETAPPKIRQWADAQDYEPTTSKGDDSVSWAIRYYMGEAPSEAAKLAVAMLAKEIATSICGSNTCFMSRNLSRLTIDQAADFRWPDIYKSLEKGMTGILEIDLFIKACNPNGLHKTGYGFSPTKYANSRKYHSVRRA